jgi:hypothetical protein
MQIGLGITGILALFLSFWAFCVASDPKNWRLWWMGVLAMVDEDSTVEQRRSNERQMAISAIVLGVLLLAMTVSCAIWTVDELRDARRSKTGIELELERAQGEIDRLSGRRR